jgi:hypothetical protein
MADAKLTHYPYADAISPSGVQRMISDDWGKPMFVPASESKPN